ncbi:hypothetical protein Poli38472_008459 [Pythium oligandrum]|uniref:CAF1B/HIR1 beta-propeller domain-containing protein n=1 Tax=Pythium oligandrum TaxID=41045 RepID=A0A8K1C3K2_PYTOL|nr:hypothetical protein Poli38472_008459 [Pythium oligandrum]|eukprot:TMW55811.1 hypothetical protein Poli38472_008459 [Pythium oligandrum]
MMSEMATSAVSVATPEIRWHCGPTGLNEAVLSLDFLHQHADETTTGEPTLILATGGADKEIKLWRVQGDIKENDGLEFIFSLTGHDRSVNCVRFSPNGQYLASASDDSTIIVWTKPKTAEADWSWDKITSFSDVSRTLLACGHKGDITDIAWSPDSAYLSSASVDNCSVIWNIEKGEVTERRKDHTQYVQGIAWDPLGEFLVTEGNDRTCRVYSLVGFNAATAQQTKKQNRKCTNMITIKSRDFPTEQKDTETPAADAKPESEDAPAAAKVQPKHRMFLDDTCPVFARRLTWTPDGSYLLAPTGVFRANEAASALNTVYAFARGDMSKPALHLPGHEKASLGVRCSPLLYEVRKDGDSSLPNFFQSVYRSIFAVVTLNAVVIYDSQQCHPVCTVKNLHYADLTDATWSADGQTLSVSSMDGYVSFIRFEEGFFGTSLPNEERLRINEEKTKTMFVNTKPTKKRAKPAAQSEDQAAGTKTPKKAKTSSQPEDQSAATKTPVKSAQPSPILQAFQKSDSTPSKSEATPATVNTLQVRKKKKIVPTLVTAAPETTTSTPPRQEPAIDLTADSDNTSPKPPSTDEASPQVEQKASNEASLGTQ